MELKHGRLAMSQNELDALCRMVKGKKTYVEIGTLWGGSAIGVALSNPDLTVYAIDPLEGYYGLPDEWADNQYPTKELVLDNLVGNGVEKRVHLITELSDPFPLDMTFDCGLIDGDHSTEAVRKDWNNLKTRCDVVAFHDVTDSNVMAVVDEVKWKLIDHVDTLMVFAK